VNVGGSRPKLVKRLVAQIAYDHTLTLKRTDLLRARGYGVVTVIGNEAAKLVLDLSPSWNFFIVGGAAATEVREEIVDWLKSKFPRVPILALNPRETPELLGADYNANQNEPELWLPIIGYGVLVQRAARDKGPMSQLKKPGAIRDKCPPRGSEVIANNPDCTMRSANAA
jgi:hypothetical protein